MQKKIDADLNYYSKYSVRDDIGWYYFEEESDLKNNLKFLSQTLSLIPGMNPVKLAN